MRGHPTLDVGVVILPCVSGGPPTLGVLLLSVLGGHVRLCECVVMATEIRGVSGVGVGVYLVSCAWSSYPVCRVVILLWGVGWSCEVM